MVRNPNIPKVAKQEPKKRTGRKLVRPFMEVISGDFLAQENVTKNLPYLLFLVFLGLVYIGNGYMAENTVRDINRLGSELKELRSEYITTRSDLMYTTKQSELVKIIQERSLGLEESFEPPRKVVVTQQEWEAIVAE